MKAVVTELVTIIGGSDEQTHTSSSAHTAVTGKDRSTKTLRRPTPTASAQPAASHPQAIIPLDDDQFSDF